jgi:hypothetical protein
MLHQGFSTGIPRMSLGVPRDIARGSARYRDWKKNKHRFLNLLAKINRSTENYHSLLKRALTIIIGLLYLQLTDHANVPWAVDTIIFIKRFPESWKLFQGFLQGKKIEKGCVTCYTAFALPSHTSDVPITGKTVMRNEDNFDIFMVAQQCIEFKRFLH